MLSPPSPTCESCFPQDGLELTLRDTLNGLPYLGAFVHEILRTQSPNGLQLREVYADATIPLGDPVRGRNGRMLDSLHLTKGTIILVRESSCVIGPRAVLGRCS